jgi:predicted aspartyl protease
MLRSVRQLAFASVFASCALTACHGGEVRESHTANSVERDEPSELRASLQYELEGHSMPQPYVNATVGTHATRFLIDTGSNTNVIARWFADEIQLPLSRAPGIAAGQPPVMMVDHPLIDIEGFGSVDLDSAIVVETSAIFEELGIAGTLSPQLLVTSEYAVKLDLQRDTLERVARSGALAMENVEGEFMTRAPIGACDEMQRGVLLRTLLVRGTVGGADVQLSLDSGALQTVVRSPNTDIPHGEGTHVIIGAVDRTLDVGAIEHQDAGRCSWDGLVGRDFLSNCVLVFDVDRVAGRCVL